MGRDRITQLRIRGLRAIDDVTLDLRGLTVLVGDNGTGKSTILEALEILRQGAKSLDFVTDVLVKGHGGLRGLLRRGSDELRLGVTIEGPDRIAKYDLVVAAAGTSAEVVQERLEWEQPVGQAPSYVLERKGTHVTDSINNTVGGPGGTLGPTELALSKVPAGFRWITDALLGIEVHVPFETRPVWQQRELGISVGPRWPATVERTRALGRYALDLPNAFQQLRNMGDEVWTRVIERARLGLDDDLRGFAMSPAGRGSIELEVVFGRAPDDPLPAEYLSEGQLSYLGFLALAELHERRSVLAFDEPELHLHPALLARVVWLLEEASDHAPIILATHSDRLLDALEEPVSSVVLCDVDEHRAVRLRRPNADKLAEWLQTYRGFGAIRAEGYESHVFDEVSSLGG
ncbi:MAG: AAA family ATPase [Nannocystaceae bacterium]